jgi:hypothetical protein
MSAFDRLRSEGLAAAGRALTRAGLGEQDATMLTDLTGAANLPALVSLLGHGQRAAGAGSPGVGDEFIDKAAKAIAARPELRNRGLDADGVARLLKGILVERKRPDELLSDAEVRGLFLNVALKALQAQTGATLSKEEGEQVVALLASGQLFQDAATATATILHVIPGLPVALVRDVKGFPQRVALLGVAIARDVGDAPATVVQVVTDLLSDGDLDRQPAVMVHTFGALFRFASLRSVGDTIATLLDNKSVRLAIVAYARANGVPLDESDILKVRSAVFASKKPDLGPLLGVALERLQKRYGKDQLARMIGRMAA